MRIIHFFLTKLREKSVQEPGGMKLGLWNAAAPSASRRVRKKKAFQTPKKIV
jgi:hypothetical protein